MRHPPKCSRHPLHSEPCPMCRGEGKVMEEIARWEGEGGAVTEQPPPTVNQGHAGYLALLDEMRALHLKKSADYGSDQDPLANLRASAEVGIDPWRATWLRAKDKVKRIDRYCQRGSLVNEGVEDSLLDLAAYAMLAVILHREAVSDAMASQGDDK